ncbi:Nephrin [Orchesella cincta]|uniref:Nephrin n=1 Tax=Orchesella cincta TaxID=48709 RepID=A0A1D2N1U6_ORCCI|nr:Nephrin [Orchesella cincta]
MMVLSFPNSEGGSFRESQQQQHSYLKRKQSKPDQTVASGLDVRGRPPGTGKKWSADKPFGKRAHFQHTSEPAKLIVESAKETDQGIYRCRVDFRNSPSREVRMNLTITVPPNEPEILDISGNLITQSLVGPYMEGTSIELQCIVREGVPSPMVQWYLNDELIDSSYHVKTSREVINHISVPNLQRSHHGAFLSCRASNTILVTPVSKTVRIDLNLRPLSVSMPIKHRNPQLTAELQVDVKCETWGSYPPPTITWWLDGREEKGSGIEVRFPVA